MVIIRSRRATLPKMRRFLRPTRKTMLRFGSLLLLILTWVIPEAPLIQPIHIDSDIISSNLNKIDMIARNNTSTAQIRRLPADGKVRILIMSACSGSTATKDMIRELLNEHGHHPLLEVNDKKIHFELFKPAENPLFDEMKHKLTLEQNSTPKKNKILKCLSKV